MAAVDELLAHDHAGSIEVTVADGAITLSGAAGAVRADVPDVDFPSYRTWLQPGRQEIPVDAAALRAALAADDAEPRVRDNDGATYDVSRLSVTGSGVHVGVNDERDAIVIGVNREFLLEALDAGDQLLLGLDDPIAPLAIRNPDPDRAQSVLMPVRLDQPA